MLEIRHEYIPRASWVLLTPSVPMILTSIAVRLVGDRRALAPNGQRDNKFCAVLSLDAKPSWHHRS